MTVTSSLRSGQAIETASGEAADKKRHISKTKSAAMHKAWDDPARRVKQRAALARRKVLPLREWDENGTTNFAVGEDFDEMGF